MSNNIDNPPLDTTNGITFDNINDFDIKPINNTNDLVTTFGDHFEELVINHSSWYIEKVREDEQIKERLVATKDHLFVLSSPEADMGRLDLSVEGPNLYNIKEGITFLEKMPLPEFTTYIREQKSILIRKFEYGGEGNNDITPYIYNKMIQKNLVDIQEIQPHVLSTLILAKMYENKFDHREVNGLSYYIQKNTLGNERYLATHKEVFKGVVSEGLVKLSGIDIGKKVFSDKDLIAINRVLICIKNPVPMGKLSPKVMHNTTVLEDGTNIDVEYIPYTKENTLRVVEDLNKDIAE